MTTAATAWAVIRYNGQSFLRIPCYGRIVLYTKKSDAKQHADHFGGKAVMVRITELDKKP